MKNQKYLFDNNTFERWQVVDNNFIHRVKNNDFPEVHSDYTVDKDVLIKLFEKQITTRHIDIQTRILKQKNLSYYTIASAGHENNIALAYSSHINDIALLHYRSSAFMLERASKLGESHYEEQIKNQLRSVIASKYDPVSNGRHKVFGGYELNVPPQTSTIASHLPKALGIALSINQNRVLHNEKGSNNKINLLPKDSIVICSFGDASFNHSTAQGALNAAKFFNFENIPLPLVYICEDNNIGISVKTPFKWIESNFQNNNITYIKADGLNILDVLKKAKQAIAIARINKKPVFFHIKTVRLMGHAGSDIEQHYLSNAEICNNEYCDPIIYTAAILSKLSYMSLHEIIELYESVRLKVNLYSNEVINEPKLGSKDDITASLIPKINKSKMPRIIGINQKNKIFDAVMPNWQQARNMSQAINLAIAETLAQFNNTILFGEDVGVKGGVYRVSSNLQKHFGRRRVFDSILDEQTIIGTAIGYAHNGLIPIIEIQFLAYLYNAIDQLRGEAATLPFFSSGIYANPFILRIAGLAYQKGFGGHFHNDNAFAIIREIPGIIIACPSNAKSAVKIWRTLMRLAYLERRVSVFLEPIALYFTKSLYSENDNLMLSDYPDLKERIELGEITINNEFSNVKSNTTMIIISYGNGFYLSRRAVHSLSKKLNVDFRIIDLNWLCPLPMEQISDFIEKHKKANSYTSFNLLVVDESRKTGSLSEELITSLYEYLLSKDLLSLFRLARITADDCFIPLGPAASYVLPSEQEIENKIIEMVGSENV